MVTLLKDGCKHMRRAFDIEDINVDELIETALSDPQSVAGDNNKAFRGLNFADLHALYREFCTGQTIDKSATLSIWAKALPVLRPPQPQKEHSAY